MSKKRLVFLFQGSRPYDNNSVRELPCGGTEKSVIYLSEALEKLGHPVLVVQDVAELPSLTAQDVLITQEAQYFMLDKSIAAKKVWWLHHFADQPAAKRNAAFARIAADAVVTLSVSQQIDIADALRVGSTVIGHGVHAGINKVADKPVSPTKHYIYASTPFRGLKELLKIWPVIHGFEDSVLHICSSMSTYGQPEQDAEYEDLFKKIEAMKGVVMHGSLNEGALFDLFKQCHYFLYPCTWRETYCIAMDEAIAHGCIPIVTPLGALPERTSITFELDGFAHRFLEWRASKEEMKIRAPKAWEKVAKQWGNLIECL